MNTKKRFFVFFLALVMFVPAIAGLDISKVFAMDTLYFSQQPLNPVTANSARAQLLSWNNDVGDAENFAPDMVAWTNPNSGEVYYAYCVNPAYPGEGGAKGSYLVDIGKFDQTCLVNEGGAYSDPLGADDPCPNLPGVTIAQGLQGIIFAGYPTRDAATILGGDESSFGCTTSQLEYAAYLATKMAVWSLIHDRYDITLWKADYTDGQAAGYPKALIDATLQAMKTLYAHASDPLPNKGNSFTVSGNTPTQDGSGAWSETFTISGTFVDGAPTIINTKGDTKWNSADGVKLYDSTGATELQKNAAGSYILPSGQVSFVAKYTPTSSDYDVSTDISVLTQDGSHVLCYGAAPQGQPLQNYVLAGKSSAVTNTTFQVQAGTDTTPPTPQPSETPTPSTPTPSTPSGGLIVYKYSTETTQNGAKIPLRGVVFELVDFNGHYLGTKATDASGTVSWNNLPLGEYHVYELSNNGLQYQLTPPTFADIVLTTDNPTGQWTFYDDTSTTVTPEKVDAATGDAIPGVEFELHQIDGNGNFKAVGTTGDDGKYSFKNVPDGTYEVFEVSTVDGYILDQTPQTVVVKNGQATSLKFTDSKYPGITITKVDRKTGATITGTATFRVEQINGTFTRDISTSAGIANLDNCPPGAYKITELSAPDGYVIDGDYGTVVLAPGEHVQYIAYDLAKPTLTIEKIDGQTGVAVPGARFTISKDGVVLGTVTAGQDGKVTVGMKGTPLGYLEPGTYSVTEVFVPQPYVLPTDGSQHQDIVLNAGDTRTMTFTDLQMPSIKVVKYDEKTGQLLPLAQFAIYEQQDVSRPVAEGMTDNKGEFNSGNIMPGTYVVQELNPPPGYTFSTTTQNPRTIVAKAGDGVITVKFDNLPLPQIEVQKYDEKTGLPLALAQFAIYSQDDATRPVAAGLTNAQGVFDSGLLQPGTYTVKELNPPPGYMFSDKTQSTQTIIVKGGDGKVVVKVDNVKLPEIDVQKVDAVTGDKLAGFTFTLKQTDDSSAAAYTYTTDSTGLMKVPGLQPGTYTITETACPPTYLMDSPASQTIKVVGGDVKTVKFSDTLKPTLIVTKTNGTTGAPAAGATFTITWNNPAGGTQVLGTNYKTDPNGKIVIPNVQPGLYTIEETVPAPGMTLPSNPVQTVYLNPGDNSYPSMQGGTQGLSAPNTYGISIAAGSLVAANFTNYETSAVIVKKEDKNTGAMLSGATFDLIDISGQISGTGGSVIASATTDSSGTFAFVGLQPGVYAVKEVKAPPNYVISNTSAVNCTIAPDQTSSPEIIFQDIPYGAISITKTDSVTGTPLNGAEFTVTDGSGANVGSVATYTTGANGQVLVANVPPGSYVITETRAPKGYVLNATPKTIQVGTDGKTYQVSFADDPNGGILILKQDAITGKPLAGAVFKVTDGKGAVVGSNAQYTTDANGEVVVPNLAPGSYIVTEIQPPTGYAIDNATQTITVGSSGQPYKVTFTDSPASNLTIYKGDNVTRKPLAGATFKVTDSHGTSVGTTNGMYTTDATGNTPVLSKLPAGVYTVTEIAPPTGYQLPINPTQTIDIQADGKAYTLEFFDHALATLNIVKQDANTHQPLASAVFSVTDADNSAVIGATGQTYTTDATGTIIITGLNLGTYTVTELTPPTGYSLPANATQTVTIVPSNQTYTLTFYDVKHSGVQFIKTDSQTRQPLSGAVFTLYKQNGEKIGTYTTDSSGVAIVPDDLPDGWYKGVETTAPAGYELDSTPQDFQLTGGQFVKLTFEDTKIEGILITKVDEQTNAPLSGAQFKVETATGTLVGNYTTDSNGEVSVTKDALGRPLASGNYIVTETKAPTGYAIDDSPKTITVAAGVKTSVTFKDQLLQTLTIQKLDSQTNQPLSGAKFEIWTTNGTSNTSVSSGQPAGTLIGTYTSDNTGTISVGALPNGTYTVKEVTPPTGYQIDNANQQVTISAGKPTTVTFTDTRIMGIIINKVDEANNAPLFGAEFNVKTATGVDVGTFTTDSNGQIDITKDANGYPLPSGVYIVTETKAPAGYAIDDSPKTVTVTAGNKTTVTFRDQKMQGIVIQKIDADTKAPLQGATFEVWTTNGSSDTSVSASQPAGTLIGTYVTDTNGTATLSALPNGTYLLKETVAPNGYELDAPNQVVTVTAGKPTTVTFSDHKTYGIEIIKKDSQTQQPLQGAKFEVWDVGASSNTSVASASPAGKLLGTYTTDINGIVNVTVPAGVYEVIETVAPNGYQIDNAKQDVTVRAGQKTSVTFTDTKVMGLQVIKLDSQTQQPLPGAVFKINKTNSNATSLTAGSSPTGDLVGTYTTDVNGQITINNLATGEYTITEVTAPNGYQIDNPVQNVKIEAGRMASITFTDTKVMGLQIIKLDSQNKQPLQGAVFNINKTNSDATSLTAGSSPTGDLIGTYTTDVNGQININNLKSGEYTVTEVTPPIGYALDNPVQNVKIEAGRLASITFTDTKVSGLQITKLNSETRQPIGGVVFSLSKMDGARIGTYTTDETGMVFIPNLEPGWYTAVEMKTADGYLLDATPHNVEVKKGQDATLEVLNKPMSGLLITKTDAQTGKPLQGVLFDVRRADGQLVGGNILDQNQPNTAANSPNKTASSNYSVYGSYTTNANGQILINDIPAGEYSVVETKALPGYELDTSVHNITITPGKLAAMNLKNKPLAGLKLHKIDSITKQPIYNVEFMVFDSNGKVVGTFYTDNNGDIDFSAVLTEGRYTIRETRAAAGYYRDDVPRTVEFIAGKVTEITWENVPEAGQIQITKTSADDNEMNGFDAGTPLQGAIFQVTEYKSGNVVDKFITGANGVGVSRPLPLGRYIITEISAPKYYKINPKQLDVTIEFTTQILKIDFTDDSVCTGVSIDKSGPIETMPGSNIHYDVTGVSNDSTVPLGDFYWRDVLPVDATRIDKIVTGTYNQSVKYKVIMTTNKGNTFTIADNLKTTKNNVIDCSNASLGLPNDEVVTSFTLYFGQVKAGFKMVDKAQVFLNVLKNGLPNGYIFANKVDVGGTYQGEWVIGNATAKTTIFSTTPSVLPKTGW